MRIENLVKIEFAFILIIVGGLLFIGGRAIIGAKVTGMAAYDESELYSEVQAGMGFNEIKQLLGEPDQIEKIEERGILIEYWYYTHRDNILRIGFKEGVVDSKVVYSPY